jgi:hypothetical protein
MAEKQREGGLGGYVVICFVGILIGRCSATEPTQAPMALAAPTGGSASAPATPPASIEEPHVSRDIQPVASVAEHESSTVYYARCADARAAGAAPIHEGEPGYAPHLDRDGDGIACE